MGRSPRTSQVLSVTGLCHWNTLSKEERSQDKAREMNRSQEEVFLGGCGLECPSETAQGMRKRWGAQLPAPPFQLCLLGRDPEPHRASVPSRGDRRSCFIRVQVSERPGVNAQSIQNSAAAGRSGAVFSCPSSYLSPWKHFPAWCHTYC